MGKGHRTCEVCGIKERYGENSVLFSLFPLEINRLPSALNVPAFPQALEYCLLTFVEALPFSLLFKNEVKCLRYNICREWLKVVGKEDLVYLPLEKLHKSRNVCADHFEKKYFNKKGNRLKRSAIPTLNLKAAPLAESLFKEFPQHLHQPIEPKVPVEIEPAPSPSGHSEFDITPIAKGPVMSEFKVKTDNWSLYIKQLEHFFQVNEIPTDWRVPTLLTVMGTECYELLVNLCAPEKPNSKSFEELTTILERHFHPKPSVLAERFKFRHRKQREGEGLAEYVVALANMSKTCEFGSWLEESLWDQFGCGIISERIRQRLFAEDSLDFAKAYRLAVSLEATELIIAEGPSR